MKELILPGYSIKNKDWAETTKKELEPEFNFEVVYWKHWENPEATGSLTDREVGGIVEVVGNDKAIVIAKSVGSLVAMHVGKSVTFEKLILCGIPLNDLDENDKKFYEILKDSDTNNVLCIQNDEDPHGSFEEVEKFIHQINPNLRIISKVRADHEYYYSEDFLKFLR